MTYDAYPMSFFVGKKRSGKTTLMRDMADVWVDRGSRFVVLDRTTEWAPVPGYIEVLRVHDGWTGETAAERALDRAPCVFVCDEIDLWIPNNPHALDKLPCLKAVVHYGRHDGVASMFACRRSVNVNQDIPALADFAYVFRHTLPRDLKFIGEVTHDETNAERARMLKPRDWFRVDL